MNRTTQGVAAAVLSNILFGVVYLYSYWLKPLSGTDVFAWRMVVMLGGLWLLVFATGAWPQLKAFVRGIGWDARRWLRIFAATPLAEIAERVHSSPATCQRRIRQLHENGVILKQVALVSPTAVGRSLSVFVAVEMASQNHQELDRFVRHS